MEQKNYTLAAIALLAGLFIGYVVGVNTGNTNHQMMREMDSRSMSHMNHAMDNMMSGLAGKTGADFEKAFLSEMIVHHEGAIVMAEALLKNTQRPELVKLGNDIITAQTGEVSMMKAWLGEWFK